MHQRVNRTTYFMSLASLTAQRSTCSRLKTGCVLVGDHRIVATGYNSSHRGTPHCEDIGCLLHEGHCVRCLHAEVAAVLNMESKNHRELTAYITHKPCVHCYKILTAVGIARIFYAEDYPSVESEAYEVLKRTIEVPLVKIERSSSP